jgi:hypothetical protein
MRPGLVAAPLLVVPLCLLAVLPTAQAQEPAFASLTMLAIARGETYDVSKASGNPIELSAPYSAATVQLGTGRGVSSIAWPGEIGAALGTTIIAAGGPKEASVLNDPVLAIAQSGVRPDATNTSVPGTTMTAHATDTAASADTTVEGITGTGATLGTAETRSTVASDGKKATAAGRSVARDITVGPVHVGQVVSTANATTDGQRATALGGTTISELSVAGQQVRVDGDGVTVVGTTLPTGAALQAVQAALKQAQITLTVSQPTKIVKGGRVEYATGALILGTPFGVFSFGGVTLQLAATRDRPVPPAVDVSPPIAGLPGSPVGPPPLSALPAGVTPDVAFPQELPRSPSLPPVVDQVVATLGPVALATGYRPLWAVVGLLLASLLATALSGLPGRWLPALTDSCPLATPRETGS